MVKTEELLLYENEDYLEEALETLVEEEEQESHPQKTSKLIPRNAKKRKQIVKRRKDQSKYTLCQICAKSFKTSSFKGHVSCLPNVESRVIILYL